MPTINPYITFNGNCEEAFEFYKSVFGNDFLSSSKFKDMPPQEDMPLSDEDKEKILHVALPIGKNAVLMGSDSPSSMPETKIGNNISISIQAESEEEADKLFNSLSKDGKVTMPLAKAFWNTYFGVLTDKFGIHWMVNHDYNEKEGEK